MFPFRISAGTLTSLTEDFVVLLIPLRLILGSNLIEAKIRFLPHPTQFVFHITIRLYSVETSSLNKPGINMLNSALYRMTEKSLDNRCLTGRLWGQVTLAASCIIGTRWSIRLRSRIRFPIGSLGFLLTSTFQPYYGLGFDSVSNKNKYQGISWGEKTAGE